MNDSTTARDAAIAACAAGLSVLPPREDGTKAPISEESGGEYTWKHRQHTRATAAEVGRWYKGGRRGVGVVCGSVSAYGDRSLVALDFDSPDAWTAFMALARASGFEALLGRVEGGYCERTPKGGRHLLAYCPGVHPTTKLALGTDAEGKVVTLIETKCEGGYLVVAPSCGPVHPSGKPYVLLSGGFAEIEEVTADEWETLCDAASSLDQSPQIESPPVNSVNSVNSVTSPRPHEGGGEPPGAAFAATATWEDILRPHGWTFVCSRGDEGQWRRPGKEEGISATTNHGGSGNLKVFTTSTAFPTQGTITKFGAYAILNHQGDHGSAARHLATLGFGTPPRPPARGTSQNSQNSQNRADDPGGGPAEPASPEPWDEPILDSFLAPEPFPLDVLPPPLADFLATVAESLGCPPDFPALAALGVASGAIGRSVAVRIKEGWQEPASLYLGLVGNPGSTKSPAINAVVPPLWTISRELTEMHKQDVDLAKEQEGAPRPVLRRISVDDATVESLAPILQDNPRGLVMVRDELSALFAGHNQYKAGGKGADRQFYLSVWSESKVTVDRKSNPDGRPIQIYKPYMAIVGGVQPGMLSEMNEAKGRDDGFIDRMLFGFPDPVPMRWNEQGIPRELSDAWESAIRALWLTPMVHEDGRDRPFASTIAPPAKERFVAWYNDHCRESEGDDFPLHLQGPWSKFRAYAARLALVVDRLAAAYDPTGHAPSPELGLASVEAAVRLVGYFKGHTRRVRSLMRGASGENPDARAVLRWVVKGGRAGFTERDAHMNFRARFPTDGPEMGDAMRWLESRRCIRPVEAGDRRGPGRYPSAAYEVNPTLLAATEGRR